MTTGKSSRLRIHAALAAWVISTCLVVRAQLPAFPGAQGFGQYATGGRAGSVYHVTTLADSGTGSFRDAVSHSGRIIVFDVGGYVMLNSAVSCANNLTIAGQTAPGDGIGIMGHEVSFSAKTNEIVRFVRFRPDSSAAGEDGINVGDGTNMIFDHISIEFGPYNNIDAHGNNGSDAITVQNSIIADPSYDGTSAKQGFGAHTEHLGGKFSWYYNLWVSEHNRQPLAKIDTIFVNNTLYNFQAGYTVANTSGNFRHDIINNYFITGPTSPSGSDAFFQMNANQSIYSTGNLIDNNLDGILNGSSISPGGGGTVLSAPWSPLSTNVTVFPAAAAYYYDASSAGVLPRDQVDALVLSQVQTLGNGPAGTGAGTAGPGGSLYNSQTQTGLGNNGYGVINGGVPALDSDGDGMPDYWEKAVGLNPNVNDAMTIAADGYANIEHYLDWLANPHALTSTNTPVGVDLWQYTGGFTNASSVYSVVSGSNGVVSLNSGHIAQFTPTTSFVGLGSFQFSVVASDGSAYTNVVTVVVSPLTQPSDLVWRGDDVSNLWGNGIGTNWLKGTNLVAFATGDNVTFDDSGSNTPAINLSGPLTAGTVYVLAQQDYTFAGSGFLAGGTTLFKTGSGQLTLDTANTFTGGTTINEGVVQVGDGVSFNGGLSGNVINNDTLIYANAGALTSAVTITGPGVVTKTGSGALTLSGNENYTGLTTIAAGSLQFSGSPPPSDAVNNGSLLFAASSFATYSNSISGPGAVTVSGPGLLTVTGTNTYTGGTTNSGNLFIANSSAVGSGPVTYNSGYVFVGNGAVVTNDFTIPSSTSDLSMSGTNNNTGIWAGNIVNLGSGASWRPGSDGGTLIFTGNALQGARNFIVPRGTFQVASNAVISASGTATALGRDGSANNRSANITFKDNSVTTLGVCSLGGGKSGGNVTVTVQNNAALSFGANTLDLHNVTRSTAVTTLRLNGGMTTVGGFAKTQTTYTNVIAFNGGVLRAGANNGAFLPAFAVATNNVQAGGAIIDDNGFAITVAAPLMHDASLGATLDGGLTKLGAGTLTLAGANTYTGGTIISNGTLALSGTGLISGTTNFNIVAGVFDVSAVSGGFTLGSGRTLKGYGTVNGRFTVGSGATLAPGDSIGTLTFNNSLTLAASCTNIFELSHSPLTNDSVIVIGALTNGGTLMLTNIGGTALAAGDSFKLFTASSYGGAFANVLLPPLANGLAWNTNDLNTNGLISVVSTARPLIKSASISGTNFLFSGMAGNPGSNYYVLTSTNVATPLSNWFRLYTNQFDNNGNFGFTNPINPGVPQTFYILRLP